MIHTSRSLRDRRYDDATRIISNLSLEWKQKDDLTDALAKLDYLIMVKAALAGFFLDSMNREQGFYFPDIGRRIEYTLSLTSLIQHTLFAIEKIKPSLCEILLSIADCTLTYRRRYRLLMNPVAVLDLFIQDEHNPRSIAYQFQKISNHLSELPRVEEPRFRSEEERIVLRMLTDIRTFDMPQEINTPDEIPPELKELLDRLTLNLPEFSDILSQRYFRHVEKPHHLVDYR